MLVAHRRCGKTVAAVNDLIEKAAYNTRPSPQYAYIAPLYKQAKDIAWKYLKQYAAPYGNPIKTNESELYVELTALPNSPRITLYGADNPDAFRGMYFDGVVLDEFGNMKLSVWKEVLLPALIDRRGWAVFMGTPNGPNHFRDMWYDALENEAEWFSSFLPVSKTHIISDEDLAMMRRLMDPEQYAQEMECSFEASVRGAIYARQMEAAMKDGRIGDFSAQLEIPTNVVLDLGFRDDTALGFWQDRPDGLVITHAASASMRPISFYIAYIKDYFAQTKLRMGQIWLPHDARAKSLQTGKSIVEQFVKARLQPKIVPNLDLLDGIAAARMVFQSIWFNEAGTKDLRLALQSYHRKYDEDKKVYSNEPEHDWSSHYADMFRYLCIVSRKSRAVEKPQGVVNDGSTGVHYAFALDNIWDLTPGHGRSRRL